jgi:AraC-like DNA-binding protein
MYAEILPSKTLQSTVECFWTSRSDGSEAGEFRVLPDGCADLIFDLSPGREAAYWVGTMTKSLLVERKGAQDFFGIRFQPGGAWSRLGCPLKEITDQRVEISAITPEVVVLLESLLRSPGGRERLVAEWLSQPLDDNRALELVRAAFRLVKGSRGELKVTAVADSLGVSRQYLNRIMNELVGVDLKTFSRVLRLRACASSLHGAKCVDWSAVAAEFGYYDQSHLTHDFRELVGLSPGKYVNS